MSSLRNTDATPGRWIEVCELARIPRQGAQAIEISGRKVAVFRTLADEVYAIENACPHRKGPLAEGIVHGDKVTCPLHSWVMDLKTGQAVAPDVGCVPKYPAMLDKGVVYLYVDAE